MKKVRTTDKQCANGCNKPCAPRYNICQRCKHGPPVPCPNCSGLKRPEAAQCTKCHRRENKGPQHNCWRGGRVVDGQGYVRVYAPHDPRANVGRYMKEHTLVMESVLGRKLFPRESVHHKNGNRQDNRPDNLELWSKGQPNGQRVEDKVKWAIELLQLYSPHLLKE